MEIITYDLPSHWASALINGDRTGLSDADERELDTFMQGEGLTDPLDCSEEPFFAHYHDARAWGVMPCDCLTYTFPVQS